MGTVSYHPFDDDEALAATVAAAWADELRAAATAGRHHLTALSGGRVSLKFFAASVALAQTGQLDPSPARFIWADERCLPPDDPESNFGAAHRHLLAPLGIAADRFHRIRGEAGPSQAADEAATALRAATAAGPADLPIADLVLLGMGEDGHVASLFPGDTAALADTTSVFRPVFDAPKPPPCRVTLGLGVILAARAVWVVVAGAGKEAALRESLAADGSTPLAHVIRGRRETRIFSTVKPD